MTQSEGSGKPVLRRDLFDFSESLDRVGKLTLNLGASMKAAPYLGIIVVTLSLAGCVSNELEADRVNAAVDQIATSSQQDFAGSAALLFPSLVPERLLVGMSTNTADPLCLLDYYDELQVYKLSRFARIDEDEIEHAVTRHFTGLGIAALKDDEARAQLTRDLLQQARASSFLPLHPDLAVSRTITPVMVAYAHNRQAFTATEREEIESWFENIVDAVERSELQRSLPRYHNIRYRQAVNQAILGVIRSDEDRLNDAITVYKNAIDYGMREDGSFLNDSERGGNAISKQAGATGHLVVLAEIMANQGIDLYSYGRVKTIENAVTFSVSAYANPDIIYPYARRGGIEDGFSAREPRMTVFQYPSGEWTFFWAKRFPQSPATALIEMHVDYYIRKQGPNPDVNAFWDHNDIVGGSAACFTR